MKRSSLSSKMRRVGPFCGDVADGLSDGLDVGDVELSDDLDQMAADLGPVLDGGERAARRQSREARLRRPSKSQYGGVVASSGGHHGVDQPVQASVE